jgi:hypothetical protein
LRLSGTFDTSELRAIGHFTEGEKAGRDIIADFDRYENTTLSVEYSVGKTVLVAEYIQTRKRFLHTSSGYPSESPEEITDGELGEPGLMEITADGWYAGASYQLTERFQVSGYYSETYNNKNDRNGEDQADDAHRAYFKDFCLTTGWIVSDSWDVKVEGHRFGGTGGISPLDQTPGGSGQIFDEENWLMFAAKVTFHF